CGLSLPYDVSIGQNYSVAFQSAGCARANFVRNNAALSVYSRRDIDDANGVPRCPLHESPIFVDHQSRFVVCHPVLLAAILANQSFRLREFLRASSAAISWRKQAGHRVKVFCRISVSAGINGVSSTMWFAAAEMKSVY